MTKYFLTQICGCDAFISVMIFRKADNKEFKTTLQNNK